MKAAPRPRIDVNLEELDQIIDGGMRAPLSESDGEKLEGGVAHSGRTGEAQVADDRESPRGAAAAPQS